MMKKVLFICTGNYYRSRFAEMLFNARASRENLDWAADSRGLATSFSNPGPVYPGVLEQMKTLGFLAQTEPRFPLRLEISDLETADLIVAINESEHRPLMSQKFDGWADRVLYWDVPDLNLMTTEDAFSKIEMRITALVQQLSDGQNTSKQDLAAHETA